MYSANDSGIFTVSVSEEVESNSDLQDLKRTEKRVAPSEYYFSGTHENFNNYEGRLQINGVLCL